MKIFFITHRNDVFVVRAKNEEKAMSDVMDRLGEEYHGATALELNTKRGILVEREMCWDDSELWHLDNGATTIR